MNTRADDETLLSALALFARGASMADIARGTGVPRTTLRRRIGAVIRADTAADPDAAAYWRANRKEV